MHGFAEHVAAGQCPLGQMMMSLDNVYPGLHVG